MLSGELEYLDGKLNINNKIELSLLIKNEKNYYYWIIPIIICILYFASNNLFVHLINIIPLKYQSYLSIDTLNKVNPLVIIEALAISIICLVLLKKEDFDNKQKVFFLNMLLINLIINIFSINSIWISRLGFYFSIANMILIPNVIHDIKKWKLKVLLFAIFILVGFLRFYITIPGSVFEIENYLFFWQ